MMFDANYEHSPSSLNLSWRSFNLGLLLDFVGDTNRDLEDGV